MLLLPGGGGGLEGGPVWWGGAWAVAPPPPPGQRAFWGILGQLAVFFLVKTILQPHNPMFHPSPNPHATQSPELQL